MAEMAPGKGCTRQAAVRHVAVGRLLSGAALLMMATSIARVGCATFIATQAWAEASQAAALVFLLRFGESRRIIFTEVILGITLGAAAGTLSALLSSWTATVLTISVAMILIHHPCPSKLHLDTDVVIAHTAPSLGFWQLLLATFWFVYRSAAGSGAFSCLGTAFAHIVMLVSAVELVGVLSVPGGVVGGHGVIEEFTRDHPDRSMADPRVTAVLAPPGLQRVPSVGPGAGVISPAAMRAGGGSGSRPAGQAGWAAREGSGHSPPAWRGAFAQVRSPTDGPTAASRGGASGAAAVPVRRRRRSSLPPLLGEDGQELAHLLPPMGRGGGACGGPADGPIATRASCPVVPHSQGAGTMLLRSASAAAVGISASGGWGGVTGGPSRVSSLARSHSPGGWGAPRVRSSLPHLAVRLDRNSAEAGTGPLAESLPDGSSPDEPSSSRRQARTFSLRNEQFPVEEAAEEAEEAEGRGSASGAEPQAEVEQPVGERDVALDGGASAGAVGAAADEVDDCEGAGAVASGGPGVGIDPWVTSDLQQREQEQQRFRYRRETGNSTHDYILLASTAPGTDGPPVYDSGFSTDDEGDGNRDDEDEDEDDDEEEEDDNDDGDDSDFYHDEDEDEETEEADGDEDGGVSDGCFSLVIDNVGAPLGESLAGANRIPRIITTAPTPEPKVNEDGTEPDAQVDDAGPGEATAAAPAEGTAVDCAGALPPTVPAAGAPRARPKRVDPASVLLVKASRPRAGPAGHDDDLRHDHTLQPGCTRPRSHAWRTHGSRQRRGCRMPPPDAPWSSSAAQAGSKRGGAGTGGGRFHQAVGGAPPQSLRRHHSHLSASHLHQHYPYDGVPMVHFTPPPDLYGGGCDVADLADFDDLMSLGEVEAAAAAAAEEEAAASAGTPDDFFSQRTDYWPSASAMTSLTRPTAAAPSSTAVANVAIHARGEPQRMRAGDSQLRVHSAHSCGAGAGVNGGWVAAPATGLPERSGVSALTGLQHGRRQQQEREQQQHWLLPQRETGCDVGEVWPVRLAESTLAQHVAAMQTDDQLLLLQSTTGVDGAEVAAVPGGLTAAGVVSRGWDGAPAPHARALMECFLRDAAILTPLPGADGYRTADRPIPYDDVTGPPPPPLPPGCREETAAGGRWESDPAAVAATAAAAERHSRPHLRPHGRSHPRSHQPTASLLEAGDVRHSRHRGDHHRTGASPRPHRSSAHGRGGVPAQVDLPAAAALEAAHGRVPMLAALEQHHRRRRRGPQPCDARAAAAAVDDTAGSTSRPHGGDVAEVEPQQPQQQQSEHGTERPRGRRPVRKLSQGQLLAREVYAREHGGRWYGDGSGLGYEQEYGHGDVLPSKDYPPACTSTHEVYPSQGGASGTGDQGPSPPQWLDRERRQHSHRRKRQGVDAEAGRIGVSLPMGVHGESPTAGLGEVGVRGDIVDDPRLRPPPGLQEQHRQHGAYPGHQGDRGVRSWQGPHSGGGGGGGMVTSPDATRMWSWLGQSELPASVPAGAVTAGASPVGWPGPMGSSVGGGGGLGLGVGYTAAAAEWNNTVNSSGGGWGAPLDVAVAAAVAAVPTSPQQLRYGVTTASTPPPGAAVAVAGAVTSAPSTPPTNVVEPFSAAGQAVYRSLSGTRRYEERDHRRGISDNYKAALAAAAAAGNRSPPGTPGSTRPPESPPPPTPPALPSSAAGTPTAGRQGKCTVAPRAGAESGGQGEALPLSGALGGKAGTSCGGSVSAPNPDSRRAQEAQDDGLPSAAPSLRNTGLGRDAPSESCSVAAAGETAECATSVEAVDVRAMADEAAQAEGEGDGEVALAAVSGSTSMVTRLTLPSEGWWRQSNGGGSGATARVAALANGGGAAAGTAGGAASPCTRCSWAAVSDLGELGDDATEGAGYSSSVKARDVGSGVDSTGVLGPHVHPGGGAATARPSMEVGLP